MELYLFALEWLVEVICRECYFKIFFFACFHSDDFGLERETPLVRRFYWRELFDVRFVRKFLDIPWREASLVSSRLPFLFLYFATKKLICLHRSAQHYSIQTTTCIVENVVGYNGVAHGSRYRYFKYFLKKQRINFFEEPQMLRTISDIFGIATSRNILRLLAILSPRHGDELFLRIMKIKKLLQEIL